MMTQQDQRYVTLDEAARILEPEMRDGGWTGGKNTIKSWELRKAIKSYGIYRRGRRVKGFDLDELRAYIKANSGQGDEVKPWKSEE